MPIGQFKARVDRLAREIKAFPKAEGIERIYVPGEMEFEEAQKVRVRGLVLDEATTNSLRELAQDLELNEAFESIFVV
jgi:LDH2 family malate/lactate/ureidoglycolate dehydrogenase